VAGRREEGKGAHDVSELKIDYSGLAGAVAAAQPLRRPVLAKVGRVGLVVFALTVLPFVILIRGGVLLYLWWGLGTWPSLVLAAVATLWLLALYAIAAGRWIGARKEMRRLLARGAMGVGVAYVVYALVFVASANVGSSGVRAEYRSLHPLLRVASSSVFLVDEDAVITDAARSREDYAAMGLPELEASLHYRQADGYVHALDLRTNGRSWLRNLTVQIAFRALGFRVLRHVGTADHLHVSLPLT
jgi:hypothetical protein